MEKTIVMFGNLAQYCMAFQQYKFRLFHSSKAECPIQPTMDIQSQRYQKQPDPYNTFHIPMNFCHTLKLISSEISFWELHTQ